MPARLSVVAKSIRDTISPLQGITATLMGTGAGPWLAHHGPGGLAVYASRVPGWLKEQNQRCPYARLCTTTTIL